MQPLCVPFGLLREVMSGAFRRSLLYFLKVLSQFGSVQFIFCVLCVQFLPLNVPLYALDRCIFAAKDRHCDFGSKAFFTTIQLREVCQAFLASNLTYSPPIPLPPQLKKLPPSPPPKKGFYRVEKTCGSLYPEIESKIL